VHYLIPHCYNICYNKFYYLYVNIMSVKNKIRSSLRMNRKPTRNQGQGTPYQNDLPISKLSDITADYFSSSSKIRPIGNSKGVILNNQLIKAAGMSEDADIIIKAGNGVIIIMDTKFSSINEDLSTWDAQFKQAIKQGKKPEKDMFEGTGNEFDKTEW
jgi:antitoxin component of MazEF toxin-antitoxin module